MKLCTEEDRDGDMYSVIKIIWERELKFCTWKKQEGRGKGEKGRERKKGEGGKLYFLNGAYFAP